jgi:hypothetical protein
MVLYCVQNISQFDSVPKLNFFSKHFSAFNCKCFRKYARTNIQDHIIIMSWYLVKHHDMVAYGGKETLCLHAYLTSAIDGVKKSGLFHASID